MTGTSTGAGAIVAGAGVTFVDVRTSSLVTRPFGPVGCTRRRSMPRSRASFRVAGVASGFALKYAATAAWPFAYATGAGVEAASRLMPGRSSLMSPTAVAAGSLLAPPACAWVGAFAATPAPIPA